MFRSRTVLRLGLVGLACLGSFLGGECRSAIVEYTSGHADIGLAVEGVGPNAELFLHYHFGVGAFLDGNEVTTPGGEEFDPSDAYIRVSDANITIPASSFPFLGNTPGQPIWTLPAAPAPGRPFLGFASEELFGLGFTSAGFRMTNLISAPAGGEFAIFNIPDPFNPVPVVYFRTNDGVDPASDALTNLAIGGHEHFNYSFTQPGVYRFGFEGYAEGGPLGPLTDSAILTFVVGSGTAIPEPGSLGIVMVMGLAVSLIRRRSGQRLRR